ncbi:helix-turn-helix transcriptional regulator [Pararhizobium gei]|uniref:helix-turn-helix transcriptional regulator n=1 Tax=Pararhizobium gei TaxID=1395951 RepID=UPI0033130264
MTKLLTADDIAEMLQLTRRSVYLKVRRGELPEPLKNGRTSRWRAEEIEALFSRKEEAA